MNRRPRPSGTWLGVLVLFSALVVGGLIAGRNDQPPPPFALDSNAPDGLLGLKLWLEEMGFRVGATGERHFAIPSEADMLFVYPNETAYSSADAKTLSDWAHWTGHTLVLVGPADADVALRKAFGVDSRMAQSLAELSTEPARALRQRQPLLPDAPAELGRLGGAAVLDLEDAPATVPVLAGADGEVTLALQRWGQGIVWHLSPRHTLTNAELKEEKESAVVPALLRTVPAHGRVVFDAYHLRPHSAADERAHTWPGWLVASWPGRAILFALTASFAFRLWGGQRLGPALPTLAGTRRREAGEFVSAMATLMRRGQKRAELARHHKRRLKIGLGRPLHLSPDLPDELFVARLRQADGRWGEERLARLRRVLAGLGGEPREEELVRLVAEADALLRSPSSGKGP